MRTESLISVNTHPLQRVANSAYSYLRRSDLFKNPTSQRMFRLAYFQYKSLLEDPFLHLTRSYPALFRDGHILDVGGNIGYTASLFSRLLTPGYQVHSFEPETHNFAQLKALSEEVEFREKIVPVCSAVGDSSENATLWINPQNSSDHRVMTERFQKEFPGGFTSSGISMIRLDDYVATLPKPRPVSFIKIDIQGYEGPALRGMTHILQDNPKAAIAIEYCRPIMEMLGFDPQELPRYFQERSYSAYLLTRKGDIPRIELQDIDKYVGKRGYIDLLFSKEHL